MPTYSYHNHESFLSLWQMAALPMNSITIEWSDHPTQTIYQHVHLMMRLTPFDWVVSYILRFPDKQLPVVHIHDRRSDTSRNAQAYWFALRWQKILTADLAPGLVLENSMGATVAPVVSRQSIAGIKELWRSQYLLRGSADHHSAANILGGLYVGQDTLPDAGTPVEIKALLAHLRDLGFVDKAAPVQPAIVLPTQPRFDRWLLVDDMARIGWESFVKQRLGNAGASVRDSRTAFEELLSEVIGRLGEPRDQRWTEQANPANGNLIHSQDIVLLDLYLTYNRDWIAILQRDLQNIFSQLSADEQTALIAVRQLPADRQDALFPALMALAFPLLPIVLFSSTEQRDVIQALSYFPNIIVDFQKPSPLLAVGGSHAYRQQAAKALERALEKASKVRELRVSINQLKTLADGSHMSRNGLSVSGKSVEVYIDESGDTKTIHRLGAIIAVYPNNTMAKKVESHIMSDTANCVGFSGEITTGEVDRPTTFATKSETDAKLLPMAAKVAKTKNVNLFYARFGLTGRCIDPAQTFPDPTFFNLIRALLETVIYDWLPDCPESIKIFAGTRVYPANDDNARQWKQFAGLSENGNRLYLFSTGTAHMILHPIFEMHNYVHLKRTKQVAAVNLKYYLDDKDAHSRPGSSCDFSRYRPPLRQLHYLADVVAGGNKDQALQKAGVILALNVTCTWPDLRDNSESWVSCLREASRFVDWKHPVKAFGAWRKVKGEHLSEQWPGYVAERVWASLKAELSLSTVRKLLE